MRFRIGYIQFLINFNPVAKPKCYPGLGPEDDEIVGVRWIQSDISLLFGLYLHTLRPVRI